MIIKKILIIVLLLSQFAAFSQNLTVLDSKYGFKDFKFGNNTLPYKNYKLIGDKDHEIILFKKITDSIGDIPIKYAYLYFIDSSLSKIEIVVDSNIRYQSNLLLALEAVYGGPTSYFYMPELFNSKSYRWKGNIVELEYDVWDDKVYYDSGPVYKEWLTLTYSLISYDELLKQARKKSYNVDDF